jgi:histidinol-phosphate aminotransferase
VSRLRHGTTAAARRPVLTDGPIRLDLLVNPYGPSVQVFDALAAGDDLHLPSCEREARLQSRLAQVSGVPPEWVVLANGIDELLSIVFLWRRARGPIVLFPPTDPADAWRASQHGLDVVEICRSPRFALDLMPEVCRRIPAEAAAIVASPNDPTGTLLGAQDAVRLTRCADVVVVDERHGEYSGRTLIPLVREFDNLIVLHTFETWAGLAGLPLAYAVAPPRLAKELAQYRRPTGIAAGAVLAAGASLDDLAYLRMTVRRVREEKSRLYRMLRKLNMVTPLPSWANFLLARVERGDTGYFVRELARRGIRVHWPQQPELVNFLRISATRPDQTDVLKQALIEIAVPL